MRRGFLVISILMMSSCFLAAGGRGQSMDAPRFTYGIEWSYIGTFFNHFHHNYITSDGYRENELDSYFSYRNNAQILLNAGCNIGKRFNLSIYAGYGGLYGTKVFPVSLRGTRYYASPLADIYGFGMRTRKFQENAGMDRKGRSRIPDSLVKKRKA